MKKIGVLLAGSGVYDGSEIHEAVLTLLAIDEAGAEAVCLAPNVKQHHVVNHLTGEEDEQERNVLRESARIARGNIKELDDVSAEALDALVIPGGFGAAKNLNQWALSGPDGPIHKGVKQLILDMHRAGKPLAGLCMGPTVLAKAFEGSGTAISITVGTTAAASPYDIAGINAGLQKTGATPVEKTIKEIAVDEPNKIVTAPCYMMEASVKDIRANTQQVIGAVMAWL